MEQEMKRHYWIHRISHYSGNSYPLLNDGYLTYGFSDLAEKDFIARVRSEGGWEYMEQRMIQKWDGYSTNRYQLWRFLCEMKAGDWVLVPTYKAFSIYELLEDEPLMVKDIQDVVIKDWTGKVVNRRADGALLDEGSKIIDLGFARRVRPILKDISRESYADAALTSRLKVRQTNVNVDDLEESILRAKECAERGASINLKAEMIENFVPEICKMILQDLSANKFEGLVKWYLERIGGQAEIMSKNPSDKIGNEDVDVMATFEPLKLIVYVQVKFHDGRTDEWAAEQIRLLKEKHTGNESMDDDYNRVYWVITSAAKYSEDCVELAKQNNIQLITGKDFARMLLDVGLDNLPM